MDVLFTILIFLALTGVFALLGLNVWVWPRAAIDRVTASAADPQSQEVSHPSLAFRDLLIFSIRHASGNVGRIALAVVAIGLLSLVAPVITQLLINSVIPRTELDQLAFCALALAVTAVAMAGVQAMEGLAMLRLEGLIDGKLQAAVIDRLLRLPASLFRQYTVGDFVDRGPKRCERKKMNEQGEYG